MSKIDGFVMVVLLLQISFMIINATGIYPVAESVNGFDEAKITALKDKLEIQTDELDSVLDYFPILATILMLGLRIVATLVLSLFSAVPTILKLFFMPDVIANAIGFAVDVMVLLGLGNMFLRRS